MPSRWYVLDITRGECDHSAPWVTSEKEVSNHVRLTSGSIKQQKSFETSDLASAFFNDLQITHK